MSSYLSIILIASFDVIGVVQWLRTLIASRSPDNKTPWLWPALTGVVSLVIGIFSALLWPVFISGYSSSLLHTIPITVVTVLATVQLGYDVVVKTFLKLLEGLGNAVSNLGKAVGKAVDKE